MLRVGQYPGGVQGGFGLFVEVQKHPVCKRRIAQVLNKGGACIGAGAVMQFEICTAMGQALGYAQNRGNPDPAGQMHINMRAGAEPGQGAVIDTGQLIAADVLRFVFA